MPHHHSANKGQELPAALPPCSPAGGAPHTSCVEGGEKLEGLWAGDIGAGTPRAGAVERGWEGQAFDVMRAWVCTVHVS